MPLPSVSDFDYAALFYSGESPANPPSESFVKGTAGEGNKLVFSFQRPDKTENISFTLEVFAFKKGTADFSRGNAALLGKTTNGLTVNDGSETIDVNETIALKVNASSTAAGEVSLKIEVPSGCSLEIDETTDSGALFAVTGTSPNYTLTQKDASGISAGSYSVNFTVKKGDETVNMFTESINVLRGMCTDTWSGLAKGAAKVITQSAISNTVYVRGAGGWYADSTYKDTATASNGNSGTFLAPFATIQKAVDAIIARNDGVDEYTIYVDGKLTQDEAPSGEGMADFSKLTKKLNLTIKALSGTATLDAKQKSRVIYAYPTSGALNLTLENLTITGGNALDNGGGIYFGSTGGTLAMNGGSITGNTASHGGGVYVGGGTFTMSGSAFIPAGDDGKNDVYLESGNTITVAGALTAASPVATITPSSYEARQVLTKGAGATDTMQDICDKFALIPDPAGADWKIVPDGANGVLKTTTVYVRGSGATAFPSAAANGSDTNSGTLMSPFATIQKAVDTVLAMNDGASPYTIYVDGTLDGTTAALPDDANGMADFSLLDQDLTLTIKALSESAKATLDGGGRFNVAEDGTLTVTADGIKKSIIYAKPASGTLALTLENLAIKGGNNDVVMGGGGGIYNAGTLTMKDCTISGNNVPWYGGGIYNRGTLTITGGTISDNTTWRSGGGIYNTGTATITGCKIKLCKVTVPGTGDYGYGGAGIYIADGGTLTAEDCEISENTVTGGVVYGAGVYAYMGTFIMEGDTKIRKNTADWTGGGVYVAYSGGTFIMNGGEISENHGVLKSDGIIAGYENWEGGGGVCVYNGGTFTMNAGKITGNTSDTMGGGVFAIRKGTFTMTGGTISGNSASMDGGGVYLSGGTFAMEGGTIEKNDAKSGGGVYLTRYVYSQITTYDSTFTMKDGTIVGNTASIDGGGVYVKENTFTMEGGTIGGETADNGNTAQNGGGVYNNGTFNMQGGEIKGNTASGNGNGVYNTASATFPSPGGNISDDVYPAP